MSLLPAKRSGSVRVPVMNIRKMRVTVLNGQMLMHMTVDNARGFIPGMLMLMMHVMGMPVRMLQRLVQVHVCMGLGQVQPHSKKHEGCGQPEQQRH